MKSSTVSKIISRIQFTLYSLFAFSLFSIILSYALLTYGLTIPHLILPGFKVEQLYIKLDKKLILNAKRIDVSFSNDNSDEVPILNTPRVLPIIDFARKNFESFTIDEINIEDKKVTFSYIENPETPKDNSFTLTSKDYSATSYFRFYDDFMLLESNGLIHRSTSIALSSKIALDFKTDNSYGVGKLSTLENTTVDIYLQGNGDTFAFTAKSNTFTDLSPIIDLFALKKSISKWIVDYNQAKEYQLREAKGIYDYNNPETFTDTLFMHAREKELNYSFHPKLFPISSPSTDVYFSKGLLTIKPNHALYNQHILDTASAVYIDFNQKHTILDVDLKTKTTLDSDIVNIVNAYDIPLPLLQEKGSTQAHIKINIDLFTEDVSATGKFFISESDLILGGVRYKIKNATARLHKNILSIDTTHINYKGILKATLNGQMDLTTHTGDIFFDIEDIQLPLSKEQILQLTDKDIRIQLNFDKKSQNYLFPMTHWTLGEQTIIMDEGKIITPIKFDSNLTINDLNLHLPNLTDIQVNGYIDLGREDTKLSLNLSNFHYHDSDLNISSPSSIPLILHNDSNKTNIDMHQTSLFKINDNTLEVFPTKVQLQEGHLDLNQTKIKFNKELFTKISTHYQLGAKKAELLLDNTLFLSPETIFIEPSYKLLYRQDEKKHHFDINDLDIHAVLNEDKSLMLHVNDLSKLYPYSNFLHIYDIKAGSANLALVDDKVGLDLTLKEFAPLLSKNGKNITTYNIQGQYKDKVTSLRINNKIDVIYHKKGRLKAKNIDFNLFPIKDYLNHIDDANSKNDLSLSIVTDKCNVALGDSGRKILADTIKVDIKEDTINAKLIYGKGIILFQSNDDDFSVYGDNLNDKFINELVKFSTFKKGKLSLAINGTYKNYKGILQVKKTIIKDYTVLNNTLAFFNTIPSLVTFSVPGYSKKGLKVDEMYVNFDVNESQMIIKDTKISSKELTITAKGNSDLEKETIDLLMQVKTDIGSSAKNIPLIGYIIFGDDSISTTVRVHGDLKDPKVESSVAKSVIVAPFNIIKRTITLPFKAFDDEDSNTTENK